MRDARVRAAVHRHRAQADLDAERVAGLVGWLLLAALAGAWLVDCASTLLDG
jgi:hypothetical protein